MSAQWKRRRSNFGDWIDLPMPEGCDMILVCVDTVQHKPVTIRLPHQAYVNCLRKFMAEHNAKSVTIMPYRNDAKVEITLAALKRKRKAQPTNESGAVAEPEGRSA